MSTNTGGERSGLWGFGRRAAVALVLNALLLATAGAQFGYGQANLPQDDFTWSWGDARHAGRSMGDFSVLGNEAGFRCTLTGKFSLMSNMSRMQIRDFEKNLRENMRFIQAAANTMNGLEAQGAVEWATLKCVKPKPKKN